MVDVSLTAFVLPARMPLVRKPGQSKRKHPEQALQTHVTEMLDWLVREEDGVFWTAIGHGGGGALRGAILKGMGLKAGVPDVVLLYRGRAFWIELKAGTGLSDAQKRVHGAIAVAGGIVTVCRSVQDVRDRLEIWEIPTREHKRSTEAFLERG